MTKAKPKAPATESASTKRRKAVQAEAAVETHVCRSCGAKHAEAALDAEKPHLCPICKTASVEKIVA